MSLTWDINDCLDADELLSDENRQTTQAMIFATIGVGIGTITADNWPEFYVRLKASGYWNDGGEPRLTPELVYRYIGLRTNVPDESRTGWLNRVIGSRMDADIEQARRTLLSATAPAAGGS